MGQRTTGQIYNYKVPIGPYKVLTVLPFKLDGLTKSLFFGLHSKSASKD